MCKIYVLILFISFVFSSAFAQSGELCLTIQADEKLPAYGRLEIAELKWTQSLDSTHYFCTKSLPFRIYTFQVRFPGFEIYKSTIEVKALTTNISIQLVSKNKELSGVTITSRQKSVPDKFNSLPIKTITSKQLELTTSANLIESLVKLTPGISAVQTGPNVSKPFIRGLGYNRVLTLYDGIRQEGQQWGDEHGIEVDAYDMEKAEVVKGPASLLYGTDAIAGVIKLHPFKPQNSVFSGRYISEYQSNNGLLGNALRLSGGFSKNFFWSFRTSYRLASNYQNAVDGKVYNTSFREWNGASSFSFKRKNSCWELNATMYRNLQGIPDGSRDSLTRKFTKQIYEAQFDTINLRPIVSNQELKSYVIAPIHQEIIHKRVYLKGNTNWKRKQLQTVFAWQENSRKEFNHPTALTTPGLSLRLQTVSYTFQFSDSIGENLEYAFGFNGMLQQNKNVNATTFTIPDYLLFENGGFGFAKWQKNKWTLLTGIRMDARQVLFSDFYTTSDSTTGLEQHVIGSDTALAYLQFPSLKRNFNGVSANIGFVHRLHSLWGWKMNFSRGFRSPSITELASNGLDPGAHLIYKGNRLALPEFSFQQDAAIYFNHSNFTFELSGFNSWIQNYLYITLLTNPDGSILLDQQGNRTYQYLQATAQLFGWEAWGSYRPNWCKALDISFVASNVYAFNRDAIWKGQKTNGEYLPLIPPFHTSAIVSYLHTFRNKYLNTIEFHAEHQFYAAQNRFLGFNQTETATPAYHLFSFGLSTKIKYAKEKQMMLVFQVDNLLNKVYQSHLSRLKYFEYYQNSPNGKMGIYGMGRNFSVKLIVPF